MSSPAPGSYRRLPPDLSPFFASRHRSLLLGRWWLLFGDEGDPTVTRSGYGRVVSSRTQWFLVTVQSQGYPLSVCPLSLGLYLCTPTFVSSPYYYPVLDTSHPLRFSTFSVLLPKRVLGGLPWGRGGCGTNIGSLRVTPVNWSLDISLSYTQQSGVVVL